MTISTLSTDTQQKIYDQILQTLGGKANPGNQETRLYIFLLDAL